LGNLKQCNQKVRLNFDKGDVVLGMGRVRLITNNKKEALDVLFIEKELFTLKNYCSDGMNAVVNTTKKYLIYKKEERDELP